MRLKRATVRNTGVRARRECVRALVGSSRGHVEGDRDRKREREGYISRQKAERVGAARAKDRKRASERARH